MQVKEVVSIYTNTLLLEFVQLMYNVWFIDVWQNPYNILK